jgi:hypothetical protein
MVDDGWDVEAEPRRKTTTATGGRSPERLEQLLREALTILDGVEPEEVALAGDGWSLVDPADPEAVAGPRSEDEPAADPGPLSSAIGEALDAAFGDGWLLPDEG